jgi:hypothetical protein
MGRFFVFPFIGLCVVLSFSSYAQKCSLDVDKVDAFSKEHVKSSTTTFGPKKYKWTLTLSKVNQLYKWELLLTYNGATDGAIKKGDVFKMKLADGKILDFVVEEDCLGAAQIARGAVMSTFRPKGVLAEATVRDISASAITLCLINTLGQKLELEVSDNQGEELKDVARCLLLP